MGKKKPAAKVPTPPGRYTITLSPDDDDRVKHIIKAVTDRSGVGTNAAAVIRLAIYEAAKKRGYEDATTKGGAK